MYFIWAHGSEAINIRRRIHNMSITERILKEDVYNKCLLDKRPYFLSREEAFYEFAFRLKITNFYRIPVVREGKIWVSNHRASSFFQLKSHHQGHCGGLCHRRKLCGMEQYLTGRLGGSAFGSGYQHDPLHDALSLHCRDVRTHVEDRWKPYFRGRKPLGPSGSLRMWGC